MERRVSVNDANDPLPRNRLDRDARPLAEPTPGGPGSGYAADIEGDATWDDNEYSATGDDEFFNPVGSAGLAASTPCLFLGSSGERCSRPALDGAYCAKHHPDPDRRWPSRSYTRVLVASIALVIILWPYFTDTLRLLAHLVDVFRTN